MCSQSSLIGTTTPIVTTQRSHQLLFSGWPLGLSSPRSWPSMVDDALSYSPTSASLWSPYPTSLPRASGCWRSPASSMLSSLQSSSMPAHCTYQRRFRRKLRVKLESRSTWVSFLVSLSHNSSDLPCQKRLIKRPAKMITYGGSALACSSSRSSLRQECGYSYTRPNRFSSSWKRLRKQDLTQAHTKKHAM